jgi:hypothetical protein
MPRRRLAPSVELDEAQAVLATLAAMAGGRKGNAALERPCETLVAWARKA